jgi:hypothetical protein
VPYVPIVSGLLLGQKTKEMSTLNPTTNQKQWGHKAHTTHHKEQKTKEMNNVNPTTNQRQWEHKAHTIPYVPIVSGLL